MEQTTRKYAGVPLPTWYIEVCIKRSSCLVAAICAGRGPLLRISSSTFISPEIDVDDHAAPCVYPSGVCTTVSKVDQLTMLPSANDFSATGTNDFSVSSEYAAQFARGIWNWLTYVYTVGAGSICEKAIGELTTASAANIRPTTTPINRLFMHFSLAGQSAAQCNTLEGRSSSLTRRFADGEGIRRSV